VVALAVDVIHQFATPQQKNATTGLLSGYPVLMVSAEERQRRSDRAKAMHAAGKLGSSAIARAAAQRSAEVRRGRSAAAIAQAVYEDHQDDVKAALLHALRHGNVAQRIKAAEVITRAGLAAQRTEQAEQRDTVQAVSTLSRDELLDRLSRALTGAGPATALLRQRIEADADVIHGTASEV
jgi:hypothetical protein